MLDLNDDAYLDNLVIKFEEQNFDDEGNLLLDMMLENVAVPEL